MVLFGVTCLAFVWLSGLCAFFGFEFLVSLLFRYSGGLLWNCVIDDMWRTLCGAGIVLEGRGAFRRFDVL